MGTQIHHAIIITSFNKVLVEECAGAANYVFGFKPEIQQAQVNDYYSIFIGPDGSKEGWEDSDAGDKRRQEFKEWLDKKKYEDGSSSLEWVELAYGNDLEKEEVIDSQNMRYKKQREALDQ